MGVITKRGVATDTIAARISQPTKILEAIAQELGVVIGFDKR